MRHSCLGYLHSSQNSTSLGSALLPHSEIGQPFASDRTHDAVNRVISFMSPSSDRSAPRFSSILVSGGDSTYTRLLKVEWKCALLMSMNMRLNVWTCLSRPSSSSSAVAPLQKRFSRSRQHAHHDFVHLGSNFNSISIHLADADPFRSVGFVFGHNQQ